MMPMTVVMKYGINAGNHILASRTPLLYIVIFFAIQSENGPTLTNPITPPATNAKFELPTAPGVQLYGGLLKTEDSVQIPE